MTVPDIVSYGTDVAGTAALIADPTRAVMLRALMSGRPLAAGDLARLAGVSAATASFHLAKLLDGGMIAVARQGRHRYYRLSGHLVAAALEAIGLISAPLPVRSLRQSRDAAALAEARTCYDHLAGRAGVELLDAMLGRGLLDKESQPSSRTSGGDTAGTRFEVTGAGARTLGSFGINISEVRRSRRHLAGECIDWTQRRGHLNGGWRRRSPPGCSRSAGSSAARACAACASPRRAGWGWPTRSASEPARPSAGTTGARPARRGPA